MAAGEIPLSFFEKLPKVELHAHINGSISPSTMEKLLQRKAGGNRNYDKLVFDKGEIGSLDKIFKLFKLMHEISDNVEAAYTITYDVIHEFAADNVKYLELRTTPRTVVSTDMTKDSYVQSVLRAIQDCQAEKLDIVVKLLLAIDRRNDVEVAMDTVALATRYMHSTNGIVVGVDLSGDPTVGDARDFIPVLQEAKNNGLRLALHLAEVPNTTEIMDVLNILPDRIGHGTFLHQERGGPAARSSEDFVLQHQIPLELCLTSNIVGQSVPDFDNHQFKFWYDRSHPCIICTDDKGIFSTTLSQEYAIAATTFDLSRQEVWDLSYSSIDHIFADESVKQALRTAWNHTKSDFLHT